MSTSADSETGVTITGEGSGRARIGVVGDVMLGRLVNERMKAAGWSYPWGDIRGLLGTLDAFCINLECAITPRTDEWYDRYERPFHFRAEPDAIETLRAGRVDFASNANNHIGDFGFGALLDTVDALERAGIAHAGAGRNADAARAPALLTVRGLRVAVLAFADYPDTWAASMSAPGLNFVTVSDDDEEFGPVAAAIGAARARADLVVVAIHWGPNMRERPTDEFRRFAHRVIDAGATVLWGHSAHILQGVEYRNGGVILYDAGDFVDDYAVDPVLRNDLGALFILDVRPHEVAEVTCVPTRIDAMQVNRATGEDREWVVRRMRTLCAPFGSGVGVAGDGTVRIARAPHLIGRASPT